ncbi:MAG: beta-galactosidase [Candidatus Hydrogenedentes bacterium]|nr:beta-galactosidase [Candidatus Hydrogenedentota bacterium]
MRSLRIRPESQLLDAAPRESICKLFNTIAGSHVVLLCGGLLTAPLVFVSLLVLTGGAVAGESQLTSRGDVDRLLDSTVHGWRFKLWETPGAEMPDYDDSAWDTVDVGFEWWPSESTCWFRKAITIPSEINGVAVSGSIVRLRLAVDNEADAYVNGVKQQHFERANGDIVLAENAQPGDTVVVALHGVNHPGYGSLYQAYLESSSSKTMVDALRQLSRAFDRAESDEPYVPRAEAGHWKGLVHRAIRELDMRAYRAADAAPFLASVGRARATLVSDAASQESSLLATAEALRRLRERIAQGRAQGLQLAYAGLDARVVESFIGYAREDMSDRDIERQIRGIKCAQYIRRLVAEGYNRAGRVIANGPGRELRAPMYHTGPFETRDGAFWQDGHPIFFTGVGHFGQVRQDTPNLNEYGLNIIQIEMGPSNALPGPDTVDLEAIRRNVVDALDNAAAHNVTVNLLVSPHYFPRWAIDRNPKLGECGMGFMHFCIDAPEARAIIEKYLRALMPLIKDHPALHSTCLSNEPQYTAKCEYTRIGFHRWLAARHGTIANLNAAYGSNYASFDTIPLPENASTYPLYFDFCRYNQDRFRDFHAFERDIIHEYAPKLPVHAKVMSLAFGDPGRFAAGINHEDFNRVGAIAGNDCTQVFAAKDNAYSQEWQTMAMNYTLQHCTAPDAPIFNSEDHIIGDGDVRYIPAAHITTAYYTQAIHGQGAAATWVWERQQEGDFRENILTRPACVRALGQMGLDLDRLGPQIHALQKAPADVAILYSLSSLPATHEHVKEAEAVFTALYFGDTIADFITERQCVEGTAGRYRAIIVPRAPNVPRAVVEAIQKYVDAGGTVLTIGDCCTHDEYGRPLTPTLAVKGKGTVLHIAGGQNPEAYRGALAAPLAAAGCVRPALLAGPEHRPVWGVNLRAAKYQGDLLVSLVNYTREEQDVVVNAPGYGRSATKLLTGKRASFPMRTRPLDPILLVISRQ